MSHTRWRRAATTRSRARSRRRCGRGVPDSSPSWPCASCRDAGSRRSSGPGSFASVRRRSCSAACIPGVAPGEPLCLFRAGEQVQGCFAFHEELRAGYEAELRTLRELGYELHLVSGDRPERVARAAAALGFSPEHVRAAMSPDDKARYVAGIDAADTLMLGDGLNDAPAFDAAFAAGTAALDRPVLPARADFAVVGSGPGATLRVLRTGQQFARVVRTNLLLALLYNAVVVVLALAGRMSPVLCAVLMPLSSLALLAHTAVRLRPSREREIAPWT